MKVLLIELTPEQIQRAKEANGSRKQITHAVVCGQYGQIFGTEKQCRKYYSAWSEIFPELFDGGREVSGEEPPSYESTFNLVNVLIEENDARKGSRNSQRIVDSPAEPSKRKGFWARLFGQ